MFSIPKGCLKRLRGQDHPRHIHEPLEMRKHPRYSFPTLLLIFTQILIMLGIPRFFFFDFEITGRGDWQWETINRKGQIRVLINVGRIHPTNRRAAQNYKRKEVKASDPSRQVDWELAGLANRFTT